MVATDSRVNVLCVTYNSASTIAQMMRSLTEQSRAVGSLAIVDNGSIDETIAIVEMTSAKVPYPVSILSAENLGFAGGMREAGRQPIVDDGLPTLCINPDLELAPNVLPMMVARMASGGRVGIATAPLVGADGQPDSASVRNLPSLGMASIYAVLGKFTPGRLRYNMSPQAARRSTARNADDLGPIEGREIEATTGALMLVHPGFRSASSGIFDTDYWMYGEDLQLCRDAAALRWKVVMVDAPESLHVKGVSSGWPRGPKSNWAFHNAMHIYYDKNLASPGLERAIVHFAITVRFRVTQSTASLTRLGRRARGALSASGR